MAKGGQNSEPVRSNIRVCQTCGGNGTVEKKTTEVRDGVMVTVTKSEKCGAGCRNGVIDIRLL